MIQLKPGIPPASTHWIVSIGLAPEKGNEKKRKTAACISSAFSAMLPLRAFLINRMGAAQCGNQ